MKRGIQALQRYLDDHNLSASEFARQHGMSQSEISKILRGQRQRISVDQAAAIQDATGGIVRWDLWRT